MIKWGIIGLGTIADKFAESLTEIENAELIAISSSKVKKLNHFGKKYKIKDNYKFKNSQKILECDNIDAIYIATVNTSHYEIIQKAIDLEKNILCEKPVTINSSEFEKIIFKLKEKKLFFSEAMSYRFHPQTKVIKEIIRSGEIGNIISADIKFGFAISKLLQYISPNNRLFDKLGGGTILDTGCYCTSFALYLANLTDTSSEPIKFNYSDVSATINRRNVEDFAKAKVIFKNNFVANLQTSFKKKMENNVIIYGTSGKIIIPNPWFPEKNSFIEVQNEFKKYRKEIKSYCSPMAITIETVSNLIKNNQREALFPLMSWKDSLDNMKMIDEWKKLVIKYK